MIETIEEVLKKYPLINQKIGFKEGVKWQQERSYSEEEVVSILNNYRDDFEIYRNIQVLPNKFFKWFEQFKKK